MPHQYSSKNIVHGDITAGGNVLIGDYITYIDKYFAGKEVKIPHRLTNYIPTNAEYILGREMELDTITGYLEAKKPTVLVNGIGGIGKTSVAIKYMAIHGGEYKHLAWLTVQSSILEAFISNPALLESLQITEKVQDLVMGKQPDNAFELVFHQLNILEKTLVVLDNANDLEDLEKYEHLFDTASCHFLITSRTYPTEWTTIPIDSLPEEEALRLFKKLHPSVQASDEAIKSLLSKLYYHTLLIELVAKSIESSAYLFEELQEIIEQQFIHSEALNEEPVSTGKHGGVVRDNLKRSKIEDYIWLIFSKVKGLDKISRNILMSMALLPLAFMIERGALKEHFSIFDLQEPMPILVELVERGWVDRMKSLEHKTFFKMHPLIADVVVEHLDVDVVFSKVYLQQISNSIYYDNSNFEYDFFKINAFKTYADRLSDLFFNKNIRVMSELLNNIGVIEEELGYYNKSLKCKERSLEIAKTVFVDNHPTIYSRQSDLALLYRKLGRYEQAMDLLKASLSFSEALYGDEHPTVAKYKANLGNVYKDIGLYEDAAKLLENALDINIKVFDKDSTIVAISLSNLANVYSDLRLYNEAVDLLESALIINFKKFGESNLNTIINQTNLASAYKKIGWQKEAIMLLEKSLVNLEKNFNKDHPLALTIKSNLGDSYRREKRYEEAACLLESTLESKLVDVNHPDFAIHQWNLAAIYIEIGRRQEAYDLLNLAYRNFLKNLGEEHRNTVLLRQFIREKNMSALVD